MARLHLMWSLVWVVGCGGADPQAAKTSPTWVNPLAEAAQDPWLQRVWFEGREGERVEGFALSDAKPSRPLVSLVAADGTRRALRLDAPGVAVPVEVRLRPDSREGTSVTDDASGLRVVIRQSDAEDTTLTLTQMGGEGGGRRVLLRDAPGTVLRHPALEPSGEGVWFDGGPEGGGVYRLDLTSGGLARVASEPGAATPVVFGRSGETLVAWVEEGEAPRVVVGRPIAPEQRVGVAAAFEEGLPGALVSVRSVDGRLLRLSTCEMRPPLRLGVSSTGEGYLSTSDGLSLSDALRCGEGCVALTRTTEAGSPRTVVQLDWRGAGLWDAWFAPSANAESGLWLNADHQASAETVPGCVDPLPDDALLATMWSSLGSDTEYTHLTVRDDELLVHGKDGSRPVVAHLHPERPRLTQAVVRGAEPPPREAPSLDGRGSARAEAGGLVWIDKRTRAETWLMPKDSSRTLRDPVFGHDGLWVAASGSLEGLVRFDIHSSQAHVVLELPGVRAPLPVRFAGHDQIAFLQDVQLPDDDGETRRRQAAYGARVPTDAERAAWNTGPITLVDFAPEWHAVRSTEAGWVRCGEGRYDVTLEVGSEGGFLSWNGMRAKARAAVYEGGVLSILGQRGGQAWVMAELRSTDEGARWWPRSLGLRVPDLRWQPADQTEDLESVASCVEGA